MPVVLYNHLDPQDSQGSEIIPSWIPEAVRNRNNVKQYASNARNVLRHVGYEARGTGSGIHGLLHQ